MQAIEPIVVGTIVGVIAAIFSGMRRLGPLYAVAVGIGMAIVFGALRAADGSLADPGLLVLIGALGASIATAGVERGDRARERRTQAILASPPAP
jgi:hypothetical protein